MAKLDWGIKRVCQSCSALFYDLQKKPIICPKCGAEFDPEAILKSRRSRIPTQENIKPKSPLQNTEREESMEGSENITEAEALNETGDILPEVDGDEDHDVEGIPEEEELLDEGDDLVIVDGAEDVEEC